MDNYTDNQMRDICMIAELSMLGNDMEEYERNVLQDSERELLELLDMTRVEKAAENLTLEQITQLTFNKAHQVINRISFKKRLKLLNELDKRLVHLYEATTMYTDQGFGKSMPPKDFYKIMGRIKHLEIIQTWLFGIE